MARNRAEVIVAGHMALDLFPDLAGAGGFAELLAPGKLTPVGALRFSAGGCVSNTGIALHRLGVRTAIAARVGNDELGRMAVERIRREASVLAEYIRTAEGETAYTLVFDAAGADRCFLHHPGVNATFTADDLDWSAWPEARIFHFGYPPLMKSMYADGGEQLVRLMRQARNAGLVTTLDMAMPDADSVSLGVDWPALLRRTLPYVDIFMPSLGEIRIMFRQEPGANAQDPKTVRRWGERLLEMGCQAVVLKLGESGLYMRTARRVALPWPAFPAAAWSGRELWSPCFEVSVAGTTGSGDSTIAGFLAGLAKHSEPEPAMNGAAAVGACSVERTNATEGIASWDRIAQRIGAGWSRKPLALESFGWRWNVGAAIWIGPTDCSVAHQRRG